MYLKLHLLGVSQTVVICEVGDLDGDISPGCEVGSDSLC